METRPSRVTLGMTATLMETAGALDTDRDLLRRFRRGDAEAFMRIYARLSRPLHAYAVAMTRDRALAEDLLQEAFVKLMEADPARIASRDQGAGEEARLVEGVTPESEIGNPKSEIGNRAVTR